MPKQTTLRVIVALLVLTGCAASAGEPGPPPVTPPLPGIDQPPPKKKDESLPEIDWSASKQSFVEDKKAIILSGSAWVRFKNIKLEADSIVFYQESREVYAEGNIRLRAGESEMSAQAAYVDLRNDTGYLIETTVRVSAPPDALGGTALGGQKEKPARDESKAASFFRARDPYGIYLEPADDPQARTNLLFRAAKVVKQGPLLFSAEDAFVTTDDMVHPMYGVKAGSLEFQLRDEKDEKGKTQIKPKKITIKRGRLNFFGVSLFPFPKITYDLDQKNPYFESHRGSSKRWGPYVLNRIGYNLRGGEDQLFDPTHVYLDLDERWKRGPGGGFEFDWQTGRRPPETPGEKTKFERGEGHLRLYVVDEIQTSRGDDIKRARRDLERRIQPKFDGFPRMQYDANILFNRRRRLEDAGPPSFDLDPHRDEWRGNVDFQHHQPLQRFAGVDNLVFDLKYSHQTDRDFMLEYFQNNYMSNNQPEALASLRKPGDNYSVELLYRTNPHDFDGAPPRSAVDFGTFTGYEPALTYSLTPTPLYHGFVLSGELQAARMRREFERNIYDQDPFDAGRAYVKMDVARPFRWGAVTFVPHVGTQQQAYDNSRDGESAFQGAVTYGLDMSTRIYGALEDYENDALDIHGMRHIIEPRISYRGVSDTRESAEDLLDFDEIDDLMPMDRVTIALDQSFQTKRPGPEGTTRTVTFAGFDMAMDYYPRSRDQKRLLDGDALDLFRMDGFLRVHDVVRVHGGLGISLEDGQVETATYGLTIDPQGRWRMRLEERFNYGNNTRAIAGSDQFRLKFEYQISERWGLSVERISEQRRSLLHRKGRQVERITLTRSYGALAASLSYSVDRNIGEKSLFLSVRPSATYRNLIVPSQDLLVASGEVSGDGEAPEERNFDPFDMLRKRKKKAGQDKGPNAPPPAPPPGLDVPSPAVPSPSGRASTDVFLDPNQPIPASTRSADVFLDPNAPAQRKRQPRKVDEDDWTTPPPTPTSTRQQP